METPNSMNEIQNQDHKQEVAEMLKYLTQSHIFIRYSKSSKKSVLLVFFNDNLLELVFEIDKKTRKIVLLSDIYYIEYGLSKDLLMTLNKEDIKNLYSLKIVTKKRVIELSATHKSERDKFVKNTSLLIHLQKEWKSTNGLRHYFCNALSPNDSLFILNHPKPVDLEQQILKDLLNELLQKVELSLLGSTNKQLHNELKLLEYENRYLLDQYKICKSQTKEKDKNLEGILTTHTFLQHKHYLRSIIDRSEKKQENLNKWRKILEFLDSRDLFVLRTVGKVFFRMVTLYLENISVWRRLCFCELNPRKYCWRSFMHIFHPYLRTRSLHYNPDVHEEIKKDVTRGLPDRIKEVEDALKLICSFNYEVGYCQGMQLVTHFLFTIYDDSDEVIETLKILMEAPYHMAQIWNNGLCRLKLAIFQLEVIAAIKFPFLLEHLQSVDLNLEIIVTPWIMTVFTHMMYQQKLSSQVLKQIWDMFIVIGWPILISTSLAILYLSLDKVMGKSLEETLSAFSSSLPNLTTNVIKKFLIESSFLEELEASFNLQNK